MFQVLCQKEELNFSFDDEDWGERTVHFEEIESLEKNGFESFVEEGLFFSSSDLFYELAEYITRDVTAGKGIASIVTFTGASAVQAEISHSEKKLS